MGSSVPEDFSGAVSARYWERLAGGRLQCRLCPRLCVLSEGQRGMCFVRARRGDEMVLTSYGRSSGFCLDPIEKKPLNHFLPGTPVLSFGTAGCNLACRFCQNWSISKSREVDALAEQASPADIAAAAAAYGARSVAFTYNDPVIFLEYAVDVAAACRARDIRSVVVTAGYICEEPRAEFFASMDAVNVDLKAFSEGFYKKLCGGELEPVLDTLRFIRHETDAWLEITTLVIPGENDSEAELHALSAWVFSELGADVPLHFSAFHPDWKMRDVPRTKLETLRRAREIGMQEGLKFVYTGNVHDPEGDATRCPECGVVVVQRSWYQLIHWGLDAEGRCQNCGTSIPGEFEGQPGDWGAQRQVVQIGREEER